MGRTSATTLVVREKLFKQVMPEHGRPFFAHIDPARASCRTPWSTLCPMQALAVFLAVAD